MPAKPVPEGVHTITPHLTVKNAAKAIDFYKQVFGAQEVTRNAGPDGKIMHASLKIGDSLLMLNDHFPEFGAGPIPEGRWPLILHIYVPDADATFAQAVAAGAQEQPPPAATQ